MKYIDKFLKVLKTDRNTFFTYILTLISIYIAVDRIVELLFMFFTGMSVSYWGPLQYTLALACPIFAFLFSFASKFATDTKKKFTFLIFYAIELYIISISMFVQWINQGCWLLLLSVPNYVEIVTEFYIEMKRAFCALALYLPVTTISIIFNFIYRDIGDDYLEYQSIMDYPGLDISKKPPKLGPYSYEISFGTDYETGSAAVICEARRFEPVLVCGVSGTGKTSLIFEPMIAHDLKQKYFFKEASKELGYTALKTGLATLNLPYDNEYLNEHFSLNMLTIKEGKEKLFNAYMSKMFLAEGSNTFRDLGITHLAPDFETISKMSTVAQNYNIDYTIIDPINPGAVGLNPFAYGTPEEVALVLSTILSKMYFSQYPTHEEAYHQNEAAQAVENLAILLGEMYPRLHDGQLANIEDILDLLNDFELIQRLCDKVRENNELATKYKLQLNYFKKYFTPGNDFIKHTEEAVYTAINQLDSLLRVSGLRKLLCNRTKNIDFDKALADGEVLFVCTRRGDLGPTLHKAFGLFVLLSMQFAVLKRPGNENSRIPNFLYIDEFPEFICNSTLPLFTMYRKYRVGTIISTQNISLLDATKNSKSTIIANSATKFVFGNNTPEDNAWWSKELGYRKMWKVVADTHLGGPGDNYSTVKSSAWDWTPYFKPEAIQNFKFKICGFKTKDAGGKEYAAKLTLDFLDSEHKEPHKVKNFDFEKFSHSAKTAYKGTSSKLKNLLNSNGGQPDTADVEPIQEPDSDFLFNNEDAIIFDIKNPNNDT